MTTWISIHCRECERIAGTTGGNYIIGWSVSLVKRVAKRNGWRISRGFWLCGDHAHLADDDMRRDDDDND